jgi:tetratricopeptide (TPR) repeat protein
VALREALVKAHPNDVVYKRDLMIGYGHVGDVLGSPASYNLGDSEGARNSYRKAVAIGEQIYNADPLDSTAKFDLAVGLERLGMVDVAASGMAESLAALQRSVRMLETLVAKDPNKLSVKIQLALAQAYTGHRLRALHRYTEAIASYRRSVALADSMLEVDPTYLSALCEAVASGRGIATAMAMAGDRAGSLRQARAPIARAQAGVDAGPDNRSRRRYVAESNMELGSIYGILARQSPASGERQDWEAARNALRQAISQLDAVTADGKLTSIDTADRQRAHNLLAEAEEHLPGSHPTHP